MHELRKKVALTAEGERSQAEAARSSREEAKALGQELQQLRERAARSAEAEHTTRRSAEAASELMRRKEIQPCVFIDCSNLGSKNHLFCVTSKGCTIMLVAFIETLLNK